MVRLSTIGVLPAELVAYILSEISGMKGSTANLKRCALVSRSWGRAAQMNLFRVLRFTASRRAQFAFVHLMYLSTKPHLTAHVRYLDVCPGELSHLLWWMPEVFTNVRNVRVCNMQCGRLGEHPFLLFVLRFPALDDLRVRYPHENYSKNDSLPWETVAVRALDLIARQDVVHALLRTVSQPAVAPSLVQLKVRIVEKGVLSALITSLPHLPALRSLHIIMQSGLLFLMTSPFWTAGKYCYCFCA
jgi:hypothetical protein